MEEERITRKNTPPNDDWQALQTHFPHYFDKQGKFDFHKFKSELNTQDRELNTDKEYYSLNWLGKSYARVLATDAATTLLRPDTEHNTHLDNQNAQNLLLKGDNLEVLKHLSNAYHQKVKMIYIDPPYNTGSDGFVYNDNRRFTEGQLQKMAGIDRDQAKRILAFTQSKSSSHSAWLTFMYPRLYIAKKLLKDDGVIFISIDDNEVAQLRLLMDEIFGEENFVGQWNWFKSATPPNLSKKIKKNIEYIICYEKGNNQEYFEGLKKDSSSDDGITKPQNTFKELCFKTGEINTSLENGEYEAGLYGTEKYPNELLNKLFVQDGKNLNEVKFKNRFTWTQPKLEEEIKNHTIINLSKNLVLSIKKAEYKPETPPSLIDKNVNVDTTENAGRILTQIFGKEKVFNYPKPISLITYLCKFLKTNNSIILDFFAGSGTTGDAVMQLNAEDGGNRQYILVQLPEAIDENKNKTAYDFVTQDLGKSEATIFEITKERLLRAAKKINTDLDQKNKALALKIKDLTQHLQTDEIKAEIAALHEQIDSNTRVQTQNKFSVFETMPIWEHYDLQADEFRPTLQLFDETTLTDDDLTALLTTWKTYDNIPLTQTLEPIDLAGYTGHYAKNKLYLVAQGFMTQHLVHIMERLDSDKTFAPNKIIVFGHNFESKNLREMGETFKHLTNKKKTEIDFIVRV